jgi:DNA repair protein RadD
MTRWTDPDKMKASGSGRSADHDRILDELGIGPNSPRPPRRKPPHPVETLFPVAAEPLPALEEMNLTPLYPYQQTAVDRVLAAIEGGAKRIMLSLPTSGGKTVIASHLIALLAATGKLSIFPCPANLVTQTRDRFLGYGLPSVGVIKGMEKRTPGAALQVCSLSTLSTRRRNGRQEISNLGLVVADEAHYKFDETFELMAEWPDVVFVGLSATPWAKGLGKYWQELIVCETIDGLIEWGKDRPKEGLCGFVAYAPGDAGIQRRLAKVKRDAIKEDYDTASLGRAMNDKTLIGDVVKTWLLRGEGRPTFCFAVNVAHSKHIRDCFNASGVAAEHMDANTSGNDREAIFERLKAGETKVVCSVGVLTTGIDEPHVSCVICARPTQSQILWVQAVGRGLRRHPGKENLIILDHSSNSSRLGTVADISTRMAKAPLDDGKLKAALSEEEEREAKEALPRLCPECACVVNRQDEHCPQCGHAFKRVCEVEVVEGDLVKLGSGERGRIGATEAEIQTFYRECLGRADTLGWKPGNAYYWTREKFRGFNAPRAWLNLPPLTPTPATINELKRQWIARKAGGGR